MAPVLNIFTFKHFCWFCAISSTLIRAGVSAVQVPLNFYTETHEIYWLQAVPSHAKTQNIQSIISFFDETEGSLFGGGNLVNTLEYTRSTTYSLSHNKEFLHKMSLEGKYSTQWSDFCGSRANYSWLDVVRTKCQTVVFKGWVKNRLVNGRPLKRPLLDVLLGLFYGGRKKRPTLLRTSASISLFYSFCQHSETTMKSEEGT